MTATGGDGTTFPLTIGVTQGQTDADGTGNGVFSARAGRRPRLPNASAAVGAFNLNAEVVQTLPGNYFTNSFGRGCINEADGFALDPGCDYNGARWFDGPSPAQNETVDNPTAGNQKNSAGAGGVYQPQQCRRVDRGCCHSRGPVLPDDRQRVA